MAVSAAKMTGDIINQTLGVEGLNNLSNDEAKALGGSALGNIGNKVANTLGLNALAGKFGGTTSEFAMTDNVRALGSAYDMSKLSAAEKAAGKGALFGKYKMENAIMEATTKQRILERIASESQLAKQADSSYLQTQNQSLFSGHRPGLISNVEKGGKLKTAQDLINK